MLGAIDQGLIFAFMALGVFMTFRILNFADLTVDGSFVTGGATAAILIFNGQSPILATAMGFVVGAGAGVITGLLHTKLRIDPLLSSILVMLALYSVNTRIMWAGDDGVERANVPLLGRHTIFSWLVQPQEDGTMRVLRGTWVSIAFIAAGVIVAVVAVNWLMSTNFGLAIWATGDNPAMAASMGISTDFTKIVTLAISNGLVGISGALMAQYQGVSNLADGAGTILIGLASVILGNAIFGTRFLWLATIGVVAGSVLYRVAVYWALQWDFISSSDMKIMSAALVVIALVASQSEHVHAIGKLLSPWRKKPEAPDQMSHVPNPYSPFQSVDQAGHDASVAAAGAAAAKAVVHSATSKHQGEEH